MQNIRVYYGMADLFNRRSRVGTGADTTGLVVAHRHIRGKLSRLTMHPNACHAEAIIPHIANPDLLLRPVELADADAWYGYLSMPHAIEHTSWNLKSADDLRVAIKTYNLDDPASSIRFVIVQRESSELVGTIGFQAISPAHRTAEIAYDLHPKFWGRGIATQCCRDVVRWGMGECGFVRVQGVALDTNAASVRVLEKCGFTVEGKLSNYRIVRGESRDFWMYSKVLG